MTDINGQGMESLQLAAIMYAASKKSDDDCLEIPAAPEPEPEPETTTQQPEKKEKPKKQRGSGFFGGIANTLGRIFTPIGDDEEGDELT